MGVRGGAVSTAVATEARFEILELKWLFESTLNNRKHYDEKKLTELTESVRQKGVLTPLLARPNSQNDKVYAIYEIAAGHRRYRAAKAAGIKTVPVLIREMTDAEFLEVLTIENLQREDVHPLDEALGYKELIDKHGYTPETIAAKVGKSESYVYQRMKLAELSKPAQKLFFDAVITPGHAILIARLSPEEQKEVLSEDEGLLWADQWLDANDPSVCSVRTLAQRIREELYLDLAKAPWKQNDAQLLPAAGGCATCPKRSGASPGLFADIEEKNICTDRKCFNLKLDAFLKRGLEDGGLIQITDAYSKTKTPGVLKESEYRTIYNKEDRCKYTQKAIIVDGHHRGQSRDICSNKDCTKHHSKQSSSGWSYDYKAQQRRQQQKRNVELERRRRIFLAVLEKSPKKLDRTELELIAKAAWKRQMSDTQRAILKAYPGAPEPTKNSYGGFDFDKPAFKHIESATDVELVKFMIATAIGPDLNVSTYDSGSRSETLLAIAKRYKVNADKITNDLKAELKAKGKKKPKSQTSAKPEPDDDPDFADEEE